MDLGKCEQPSEVLFSDTKGDAPFLRMQTQKHSNRHFSYIANLRTEARKDRKERLKWTEINEPSYISNYKKEVKEFKGNLINKHKN